MSYGDRSFKAQMKRASSSAAAYAIIIGEDELAKDVVTIRHEDAESVEVKRSDVVAYLRGKEVEHPQ